MIQSDYTVRVLEPAEGFTLTQAADVEVDNRVLSKKVFLAVNDSPDNWKEISDAEADEIRKQQEEIAQKDAEPLNP